MLMMLSSAEVVRHIRCELSFGDEDLSLLSPCDDTFMRRGSHSGVERALNNHKKFELKKNRYLELYRGLAVTPNA
jgi:hypothetical protein